MEMDFLLSLAGDVGGDYDFDLEVYEDYMKDCMGILESHPCSITLVAPKSPTGKSKFGGSLATIPGAPREIRLHTLRPEDPMLRTMMGLLGNFFTNSVEVNLSLTGAIIDLATCGYMRIDGWLLPDPSRYVYEEEEDDDPRDPFIKSHLDAIEIQEKAQLRALKNARRPPKWVDAQHPIMMQQLKSLVDQVTAYRADIPRFEDILQQRRDAFQAAASASATALPTRHAPPRSSLDTPSRDASPPRNAFDSLAQRMFPELATPSSRSHSPRGRRSQEGTSASGSGSISGGYGLATPTTTTTARGGVPPPQFPMPTDSPSRGSSRAFSASPLRHTDTTSNSRIPTSQAAAFAAVDQSILARKVGLPLSKAELAPIPFPNLRDAEGEGSKDGSVLGTDDGSVVGDKDREKEKEEEKLVSVSHVLTNVIVLQEFLLELAALVQVRAGLFGEVRFA